MNEFEILGITIKSTKAEVKKAYKRLAQIHHPDKSQDNGEKFKQIKNAYDLILKEWEIRHNVKPKAKPSYKEPEQTPVWTWKDFTKKPDVDPVFHSVNVNFSELFGSTVQIPNSMYYVNVPYGVLNGTKQSRVKCSSLDGRYIDYFNIEYHLYDPTGFFSIKTIEGVNSLYCQIEVTSAMVLGEYEIMIRNINPNVQSIKTKASSNKLQCIPHCGLPGLGGMRGNLYVDQIITLKPLEEEIYPVIINLQKKLNTIIESKSYKQNIK